jgi:hypothetical protein
LKSLLPLINHHNPAPPSLEAALGILYCINSVAPTSSVTAPFKILPCLDGDPRAQAVSSSSSQPTAVKPTYQLRIIFARSPPPPFSQRRRQNPRHRHQFRSPSSLPSVYSFIDALRPRSRRRRRAVVLSSISPAPSHQTDAAPQTALPQTDAVDFAQAQLRPCSARTAQLEPVLESPQSANSKPYRVPFCRP